MLALRRAPTSVNSRWFSGRAEVTTYEVDELLATKLRALYQRNKGRDLYDLWTALLHLDVDDDRVVGCFRRCLSPYFPGSRTDFEASLDDKLKSAAFRRDLEPLLRFGVEYDIQSAAQLVRERIISRLPD